jgi:hypothetical protein
MWWIVSDAFFARQDELNPDFRFGDLLDNLLTSPDAFIHAGFNHMKTLRRATPNG